MTFDCYCAICGSSITGGDVGSKDPKLLAWRREHIERKRKAIDAGEEIDDDLQPDFEDFYDEYNSYDPDVVSEQDINWLESVCVLGFNNETGKAFISGPAQYDDSALIEVEMGNDPDQPDDNTSFTCYLHEIQYKWAVYPFHYCCLEIMSRAVTGFPDTSGLNKNVLYSVMNALGNEGGYMNVDYGNINGQEQHWRCVPGEEFSVSHPVDIPEISNFLRDTLQTKESDASRGGADLGTKVRNDPFSKLPLDILFMLSDYIDAKSLRALILASWAVDSATRRNPTFWRRAISSHMPWFWELHDVLKHREPSGPSMGLANRRRIWKVGGEISDWYWKLLGKRV